MNEILPEAVFRSLGLPAFRIHHSLNHFDFTKGGRRILVVGPMGSGKTEYAARVWRDSQVTLRKDGRLADQVSSGGADRRRVFVLRSSLDARRFPDYPEDALAYRGGYERCGSQLARIAGSFDLERIMGEHPDCGTWIIDEASFYDERLVYVVLNEARARELIFIFPSLILNFRRDIFNATARLLLEAATDVFPLTAYCEHPSCLRDSFYTYRYYLVDGEECPAIYFDPLIIIGGDREKVDGREPNYCTRCEDHHVLPGKAYTYLHLKPLGEAAAAGDPEPLRRELAAIREGGSLLHRHFRERYTAAAPGDAERERNALALKALRLPFLAERALIFLYAEQNLVPEEVLKSLVNNLGLDKDYLRERLADNRRPVQWLT